MYTRESTRMFQSMKAYTSVLQYINCLVDTVNATCDYNDDHEIDKWEGDMLGLQQYLFGIDPQEEYRDEVYIGTVDMEELIEEVFIDFMRVLNILSFAYHGYTITNILYNVSMRAGVVFRACYNIKCFMKIDIYTENKVDYKSLNELFRMPIEESEKYTYVIGVYRAEFWQILDETLTKEIHKMNDASRRFDNRDVNVITPYNIVYEDVGIALYVYNR